MSHRPKGQHPDSSFLTPDSPRMYLAIAVMGLVVGLLAGWVSLAFDIVFLNLHAAIWVFLIVWAGATAYFSYKNSPSGVVATGLYLVAILIVLGPFATFLPALSQQGTSNAQTVQGMIGLFVWASVSGLLAVVFAGLARHFQRRETSHR